MNYLGLRAPLLLLTAVLNARRGRPMARSVDDLIDLYRVISRPDPRDTWSLPYEHTTDIHAPLSPAGLKIGVMLDMG
ncbi:hypothetical protein [Rhodococcus sovatensis]|uniref:Uncharacterized protein n=1 Tax=Rhodococcus sovatensis TaxID=1805840 RepID=A0ABZ2PNT3_9NOCA